jgi:hypothetical protein
MKFLGSVTPGWMTYLPLCFPITFICKIHKAFPRAIDEGGMSIPPFEKGGREDLKGVQVCTTLSIGRGKNSPHPSLSKRGVQTTWQVRIGEADPRSCPAASSFSTTFATDPECLKTYPGREHGMSDCPAKVGDTLLR